ncbi:hypothetical protein WA026_022463 [Henosepilachna vigintioctopunctata]|uniref:ZAD domain-containing protein n=1 Tax=Henosepilachna vigintioctopunctata TaxID=420089 RepID=A0AAW1TXG1_9CUCU
MESVNKKNIVDYMEVCRLCLGTENLISVFDDRIKIQENIVDVIQITSGVTITRNDKVSHKLCNKCIHITVKMFKFRSSALVNDNQLKALADVKLKVRFLSETVEKVLKKFPKIKLPSSISECNISPVVAINENDVPNWLEQFKKKQRAEKNRRKEAKEIRNMSENSSTSGNESIAHESLNIDLTHNLSMESSELNSSTSLLFISRESPIPDVHEVDEDQHKSLQETQVPDMISLQMLLNNSVSPLKRISSVQADSPKSKKIKTNSNFNDEDSINSLVTVKYINKSLSICDICNGILNSAKDLKKHKISHMRCSLCKKVFRTMKETNEHNESGCSIKRIMNNLPSLKLTRCDDIGELSKESPKASGIQSDKIAHVTTNLNSPTEPENQNKEVVKVDTVMSSSNSKPNVDPNEILLISDDEDEVHQPVVEKDTSVIISNDDHNSSKNSCNKSEVPDCTFKKTIGTSNESALNIVSALECQDKTAELSTSNSITAPPIDITGAKNDVDMTDCVSSDDEFQLVIEMDTSDNNPEEDNTSSNSSCNNKIQDSILKATAGTSNKTALKISNNNNKHDETAAVSSSTSIITPNIEITGTNIIDVDFADNDTALLKNLLRKAKKNTKEAGIQTVIPCNADITPTFKKDKLFELKNLRDYLNFYKIPINISYAANYSVRISSDSSPISKNRTWSKVNTKVSKSVTTPKLQTPIPNTPPVTSVKIGTPTPMTISSAERIPAGSVTNVEKGNACTESFIPSFVIQRTQSVPNLVYKNTESSVSSPMSISESTSMTIPSTERIPAQLVTFIEKSNVNNESATSTGAIKNTQFKSNNQGVSSTLSNSVYMNIGHKQPTLNSNPPILLNYSLPNVSSSYIMPNNYLLAQPSSSQRLPPSAATTNNAKGIFTYIPPTSNMYNNHYFTNSPRPLGFPNASSPARVNMSSAPTRMDSSTIVRVSNGTTILTPTKVFSAAGNKASPSRLNVFTSPPNITCPPNINMISVPGSKPSDTRVNISFPNMPSLHKINTPNVSVTNNMPPPTSSFIPHRVPKAISTTTDQIPGPAKTDSVSQNSNSNSSSSSNFKQTIRVRNMNELI